MGIESEVARRRSSVEAAIASFGGPEAEYHAHIMACDACAGGYGEMCGEGRILFDRMMREGRREGER